MELILKQPFNKPPCICILFDNSYEASRLNQSFVIEHKTSTFDITFEWQESNLDLILKLEDGKINFRYFKLLHSPEKFQLFLSQTKASEVFSFCHIIKSQGKLEVVKTLSSQTLWVIKVKSLEVIKEY